MGVEVSHSSSAYWLSGVTANSNSQAGVVMYDGAQGSFTSTIVTNSEPSGFYCVNSSTCGILGALISLGNTYGIYIENNSIVTTADNITITGAGGSGDIGIYAGHQSSLALTPGSSKTVSMSRSSSGGTAGIYLGFNSDATTGGTGSITIDKFTKGISTQNMSIFYGDSSGTRSITNATTAASIQNKSLYNRGGFTSGTCDGSSTCQ